MSELRARLAAALPSIDDVVAIERPSEPVHCLHPARIITAAEDFVAGFNGDVLYAVKCNPEPVVLQALWEAAFAISTVRRWPKSPSSRVCCPKAISTSCIR
jgi:diaminopimelate decarboxylase